MVLGSSSENRLEQEPTSTALVFLETSMLGLTTWHMCENVLTSVLRFRSSHVNANQVISASASKNTGSSVCTDFGLTGTAPLSIRKQAESPHPRPRRETLPVGNCSLMAASHFCKHTETCGSLGRTE